MEPSKISNFKVEKNVSYYKGSDMVLEAWDACQNAYNFTHFYKIEYKNVMIIAFSGFQNSKDFMTENGFDECNLSGCDEFEFMADDDLENSNPPLVRKVFLDRFLFILQSSNLTKVVEDVKAQNERNEKKTIILTGHSMGGAIACLCTVWVLGKFPTLPARCTTFGCPLVGDKIFGKAIEREKWSPYFCHIVSRHDIVPRICFSPLKSKAISKALEELMPFWYDSIKNRVKKDNQKTCQVQDGSHPLSKESSEEFIKQVIIDASEVVTHETSTLVVGAANLVGGAMREVIKRSPYRPFGHYVFCSTSGTVCSIHNPQTTLHMLYFALQNSKLFGACIMEHIEYDKTLTHISKSSGLTTSHSKIVKSEKSTVADVTIDMQLETMAIGNQNIQAWLALKAIAERKNELGKNMKQQAAKLEEMEEVMAEVEWYKIMCEPLCYYDCFKSQKTENELRANKNRVKLAAFWDRITELVGNELLPNDLPSEEKWVNAGSEYRLLVEPLDIAHYYRLGKHEEYGSYLSNGRPARYKILQKWEEKKKRKCGREARVQDSCFWANDEDKESKGLDGKVATYSQADQ